MVVERMELDAASDEEAHRFIASTGAQIISLRAGANPSLFTARRGPRFNLSVFNQQLFSLLEAGQPIVDAIEILGRNDKRGRHRAIYDTLLNQLRQGRQLSEAMSGLPSVFPPLYTAMVRSSETTGAVRLSIERYMRYQKQVDEVRGKLVSAAIYPAILLAVGFLVIAFLLLYVVPSFSAVFEDVALKQQASGAFIQAWGGFVRHHTVLAWSGFGMSLVGAVAAAAHPRVRATLAQRVLRIPLVGEKVQLLQLARMYRTLGMLLQSGVSVLVAMRMTEASLAVALQASMRRAAAAVAEGRPMSLVMPESGLSTEVAQRLLLAGESSGNLDDMMIRIADFYDQELAGWIDTAGRLVEPILMVGIGLIIGAVVLMLYAPIFDLANAV